MMQNNTLSVIQSRVVDAVIASKGSYTKAGALLGQTGQYIGQVMKVDKVKTMYEHREQMALKFVNSAMAEPIVTKQEVVRMFLEIAQAGMERGFDKEGNSIMINPGTANTALGNINQMYAYNAPTETIVTKVDRTELEISASINSLQSELTALLGVETEHDDDVVLELADDGDVVT